MFKLSPEYMKSYDQVCIFGSVKKWVDNNKRVLRKKLKLCKISDSGVSFPGRNKQIGEPWRRVAVFRGRNFGQSSHRQSSFWLCPSRLGDIVHIKHVSWFDFPNLALKAQRENLFCTCSLPDSVFLSEEEMPLHTFTGYWANCTTRMITIFSWTTTGILTLHTSCFVNK